MCPPFFGGTGVNKSFYLAASARRPLKGQHGTDFIGIGFGPYAIAGEGKIYTPGNSTSTSTRFVAAPILPDKLITGRHSNLGIDFIEHLKILVIVGGARFTKMNRRTEKQRGKLILAR